MPEAVMVKPAMAEMASGKMTVEGAGSARVAATEVAAPKVTAAKAAVEG
jgi:hypothetical protein